MIFASSSGKARRTLRLWLALLATGAVVLSVAGVGSSATVGPRTNTHGCLVANPRAGRNYPTLQAANDAPTTLAGDTLTVRGACFGATTISKSLTIVGKPRHGRLGTASLNGGDVDKAVVTVVGSVTVAMKNLLITGGAHVGGLGGAVSNAGGMVTLTNTTITGNAARLGGGIYNVDGGTVTLNNSTVSNNTADAGAGAGIYNDRAMLTLNSSTVTGNTGASYGGGISNHYGTLTLTNSTVTNGTARFGGGIFNDGAVTLTDSTVTGNAAKCAGGIYSTGTITLHGSSTVGGNDPDDRIGPLGEWGC